jgi:hypothetical protein
LERSVKARVFSLGRVFGYYGHSWLASVLRERYLIHDRDPLFTANFLETIASVGAESVQSPPRAFGTLFGYPVYSSYLLAPSVIYTSAKMQHSPSDVSIAYSAATMP